MTYLNAHFFFVIIFNICLLQHCIGYKIFLLEIFLKHKNIGILSINSVQI